MDKIIQPWGYGEVGGEDKFPMYSSPDTYEMKHGQLSKIASKNFIHPDILSFVDRSIGTQEHPVDPDSYIYIIASNMGAGESWGANINADRFPRKELSHTGRMQVSIHSFRRGSTSTIRTKTRANHAEVSSMWLCLCSCVYGPRGIGGQDRHQ